MFESLRGIARSQHGHTVTTRSLRGYNAVTTLTTQSLRGHYAVTRQCCKTVSFRMWLLVVREVETEDFAGEPKFFHVVFATLASQTVLAREAESIQKKLAEMPAVRFSKPPGEWQEHYLKWKTRTAPQQKTQNRTVLSILQQTARNRNML